MQVTQANKDTLNITADDIDKGYLKVTNTPSNENIPPDFSFEISVTDQAIGENVALTDTATITMDVLPINDDPVLVVDTDNLEVASSGTITINETCLSATDVDSTTITYSITELPKNGTLYYDGTPILQLGAISILTQAELDADLLEYHHNGGSAASDSFTVVVRDGEWNNELNREGGVYEGDTLKNVVIPITITHAGGTEGDPAGATDTIQMLKNTTEEIAESYLLSNDTGALPMDIVSVTGTGVPSTIDGSVTTSNGTVSINSATNIITYTPNNDFTGSDSFIYTREDGTTATVNVYVYNTVVGDGAPGGSDPSGNNDPAMAGNDNFQISEDQIKVIAESDLLSNDSGDLALDITDVSNAVNGSVSLNGDGTITFTPTANFSGTASFDYTLTDSNGDTDTATVTISVLSVNDSPTLITTDVTGFDEGGLVTITSTALDGQDPDNDADQLTYSLTSLPPHGTLYFDDTPGDGIGDARELGINESFTQQDVIDGKIKFLHDGGETHSASFNVRLTDGSNFSVTQPLTLTATPVNDAPTFTVADPIEATVNEGPYDATDNPNAAHVFTATEIGVSDPDDVDEVLTITLDATPVPAHGDLQYYDTSDSTWKNVVTGDTPTEISVSDISNGYLRYINNGDEVNTDTFNLIVSDDEDAQSSITVNMGIILLNDDPTQDELEAFTTNTGKELYEGEKRTITTDELSAGDLDNTQIQRQFRITVGVGYGQLIKYDAILDGSGNVTSLLPTYIVLSTNSAFTQQDIEDNRIAYIHDGSQHFSDSFGFTISDAGGGDEPSGVFEITVLPINDAPTIDAPTSLSGTEEQPIAITGITIGDPDALDVAGDPIADFPDTNNMEVIFSVTSGTLSVTATDSPTDSGTALPTVNGDDTTTLTITGSLVDINATLGTLTYTGNANFVGNDTMNITVKDGGNTGTDPDLTGSDEDLENLTFDPALSDDGDTSTDYEQAIGAISITVNPVNDPPVNSVPGAQTVLEDTALVFSSGTSNAITIDDPDIADGGTYKAVVTLSVAHGTLTATADGSASISGGGTSTFTITGSKTDIDNTLDGLTYQGIEDYYGDDTLAITTQDQSNFGLGGEKSATDTVAITVSAVNDAPTSNNITPSVNEDNTLTFTLPSSDTGENAIEDSQTVDSFIIVSIPDTGTLTKNGGGDISAGDTITEAEATNMTFDPANDFNGTVSFTFKALDSGALESVVQTATITVNAVNDAPTFNTDVNNKFDDIGSGNRAVFIEGSGDEIAGTPVLIDIDGNNQLTGDIELFTAENGTDYAGTTLTVQRNSGINSTDRFALQTDGTLSVTGTNITVSGQIVAILDEASDSNGKMVITFNASADKDDVNAVMQRVTFNSVGNSPPGTIEIALTFDDAGKTGIDPGTSGTDSSEAVTGIVEVEITPTNDPPTLSDDLTMDDINEDAGDDDNDGTDGDDDVTNNTNNSGQTVSDIVTGFSDDDGDTFAGIAIIGNNSASVQGEWQYSIDNGTSWQEIPTDSAEDDALYLDTADKIRFVPDSNANNDTFGANGGTPALTIKAVDNTTTLVSGAKNIDATGGGISAIATDSVQLTASVIAVNDTPIIADLNGDTTTFTEGIADAQGTAILLDQLDDTAAATLSEEIELLTNAEGNFSGTTLTVVDAAGPDSTDFFFIKSGTNGLGISGSSTITSGQRIYNDGSTITYNGTEVATVTDNSVGTDGGADSGILIITFNADATSEAINAILQNISFNSDKAALTSGTKNVNITFDDAGKSGIDPSTPADSSESYTATVSITLLPTNDSPALTNGYTIETQEAASPVVKSITDMLGDKFSDPDAVTANTLAGVALSAYNDQGLGTWWVDLDGGDNSWVELSTLQPGSSVISDTNALLLGKDAQVKFVPTDGNVNTAGASLPSLPSLTVYAVENLLPPDALEPTPTLPESFSATGALTSYNVTTDTLESRVSGSSVTIDVDIAELNDAPEYQDGSNNTITAGWSGTLYESATLGVGTDQQKLVPDNTTVYDLDLGTTETLADDCFGAGSITVKLNDGYASSTGDVFSLTGLLPGVASASGGTDSDFVITLENTATITQVNAILQAIRFKNTSDNPPITADRAYTITLSDGDNLDADGDTASGPAATVDEAADALTATLTGTITISLANDPPTLTANALNPTFTETDTDNTATLFDGAATDTIQEGQTLTELQLTVSNLSDSTNEKLTIDGTEISLTDVASATTLTNSGSVSVSVTDNTATVTYTHGGLTEAQTSVLVNALLYRNTSQDPTDGGRVVTITSLTDSGPSNVHNDNTSTPNIASTVSVISVNDAPDLTANVTGTYTEGNASPLQFLTGVVLSDVDSSQFNGGSLTIEFDTNNFHSGDTLEVVDGGNNITVSGTTISYNSKEIGTASFDSNAGTLTISFTSNDATFAAVQALAQQIGYSSTSENPTWTATAPDRSVTVTVNDGGNSGTNDDGSTGTATTAADFILGTFNVEGINDEPTLTALDATSSNTYIQDGSPVVIDADAALGDLDLAVLNENVGTGNWNGSTLTIARNSGASAEDIFGATGNLNSISSAGGNIVASGTTIGTYANSGGTLVFTFNANATTALVNTALNSITYSNSVTTAGSLGYDHVDLDITFDDQNSNNTNSGIAGSGQDQGSEGQKTVAGTITVNIDRLPVGVDDGNSVDEGVATSDTTEKFGNVLTGLDNTGDAGEDSDQDIGIGGRTDALVVTHAKDSSDGSYTAVSTGTINTNGSEIAGDYGALKIGADGSYTYSVDNNSTTVQALATGEILTDTFTYEVHDGVGGYNTAELTITINGTNDGPVITDGPDTAALNETDSGLTTVGSLTIGDVDTTDEVSASFSLTNTIGTSNLNDTALTNMFSVTPTGILDGSNTSASLAWSFNSDSESFDYLASGETLILEYTVTVTDDDSSPLSDTETVTITITGTNDTPEITFTAGNDSGSGTEDTGTVQDNPNTDGVTETGAYLTDTGILNFTDEDTTDTSNTTIELTNTATSITQAIPVALNTALGSAMEITGDVSSANNGDITWTFALDNDEVQYLANGETVTATYTVTVTDDSGYASASGDNEISNKTQIVTVTITGTNDAPELADTVLSTSATEDDPVPSGQINDGFLVSTLTGGISDDDQTNPQGIAITNLDTAHGSWYYRTDSGDWTAISVVPTESAALLLKPDARLYFVPSADWNGTLSDAVTFRAWDQSSGSEGNTSDTSGVNNGGTTAFSTATDTLEMIVDPVNDQPIVTLPNIADFTEDDFDYINGITVSDPDSGDAGEDATTTLNLSVTNGRLRLSTTTSGTASVTSGNNSNEIVITGKVADINALLTLNNNLTYQGNSNFSGVETLSATIDDHGNVGSGSDLNATASETFTITGDNDAPTLTVPGALSVNEDIPNTVIGTTFTITDPDIVGYTMQADVSVINGTLNFNTIAGLTFVNSNGDTITEAVANGLDT